MKKLLALIMTVTMIAMTMAGCGGGSTGTASSAAPAPAPAPAVSATPEVPAANAYAVTEPIEIEFWHSMESQHQETIDKLVAGFQKLNPNIKVKAIYQGSYTVLNEKLIAAQAAGTTLPAVTVTDASTITEYAASGVCEVLDPYIKATKFDIDDFGAGMVASSQYEGKQVSLPFLVSTQIMYYNKTMADAEGIKLPETWADMDEFVKKASKVNNGVTERYATITPGWGSWYFETTFLNQGVKIINDDGKTTDLDSDKAIAIANQYKKWCDDGMASWGYGTDASSKMRQNFIDGKTFSVMHTSSLYNTYLDKCTFELGMHYYPGDVVRNSEVGGSVLLIPAKNDQKIKNAAWQFMTYVCGKDANMMIASDTGYMPTRNSVLTTEEGKKFLEAKPAFKAIFDHLDNINPVPKCPVYNSFTKIWCESLSKNIIEGGDMAADMKAAAKLMNEVLADA